MAIGLYILAIVVTYRNPVMFRDPNSAGVIEILAWGYAFMVTAVGVVLGIIALIWWLSWALTYDPAKHGPKQPDASVDPDFR